MKTLRERHCFMKNVDLGKFLKEAREKLDLSQREVAEALGYSTSQYVSNFERNKSRPPLGKLRAIARIYKLDEVRLLKLYLLEINKWKYEAVVKRWQRSK